MRRVTMMGVVGVVAASSASGVTLTPVLKIGDSTSAGTVNSIGGVTINQVGGFAVGYSTASTDAFYGSATGLSPAVLLQEGVIDGETVTGFNTGVLGLSNSGNVAWRGTIGTGSAIGVDATSIVAKTGGAIPSIPGVNYNVMNGPSISADGTNVFFRSSTSATAGAAAFANGGSTALLIKDTTNVGPGVVFTAPGGPVISPSGAQYLSTTQVNTAVNTRNVVVVNGTVPQPGGTELRQSLPVPNSLGGDGTVTWNSFSSTTAAINDSGTYLVTGTLGSAAATVDAFLAIDGSIILREGDLVDGALLTGAPLSGALNNAGDWAAVWGTDAGEALIVNGSILLKVGDSVGAYGTITDFTTGLNQLQLGLGSPLGGFVNATTSLGGVGVYAFAVPEPASLAAVAAGLVLVGKRRRAC